MSSVQVVWLLNSQVHLSPGVYGRMEPFTPKAVQINKHMYDWILFNTCSSINLFCNRSFVCNVHQVNTTLSLATNAGMMITNLKAELPGYGMVWFDIHAMTNVLSFGNIAKQYPI